MQESSTRLTISNSGLWLTSNTITYWIPDELEQARVKANRVHGITWGQGDIFDLIALIKDPSFA